MEIPESIREKLQGRQSTEHSSLSKEDLLIQFINMQQQYYADMRDMAHQHAKLATDLINIFHGTVPTNNTGPVSEEVPIDFDIGEDLRGGELGAD